MSPFIDTERPEGLKWQRRRPINFSYESQKGHEMSQFSIFRFTNHVLHCVLILIDLKGH